MLGMPSLLTLLNLGTRAHCIALPVSAQPKFKDNTGTRPIGEIDHLAMALQY